MSHDHRVRGIGYVITTKPLAADACIKKCPPPGFDSVKNFDEKKFIEHSWYVQEQAIVTFQRAEYLYCVVATYEPKDESNLFEGLTVYNYANRGRVNGPPMGTSGSGGYSGWFSDLEAVIPNKDDPSKLLVGLSALRPFVPRIAVRALYGPYWVVALGEDDKGGYRWAIVSGGAPEVPSPEGCKTGYDLTSPFKFNGVGLWLFSREPQDPASTKEMRSVAKDLGFDISVLYPVTQEGCKYKGAVLK